MTKDIEGKVGVICGKCKQEKVYFRACPKHHWAISSYCMGCGEYYKIADNCKECNFPKDIL